MQNAIRELSVLVATFLGLAVLVSSGIFLGYWLHTTLQPDSGALPGDLRHLILTLASPLLAIAALAETLFLLILIRAKWISGNWRNRGVKVFGITAIALLICTIYFFHRQQWLCLYLNWGCSIH